MKTHKVFIQTDQRANGRYKTFEEDLDHTVWIPKMNYTQHTRKKYRENVTWKSSRKRSR